MHKQTVTFEDFAGVEHTKDFYFHISRSQIIELTLTGEADDLLKNLQSAVKDGNGGEIIRMVRDWIKLSYGEKDEDDQVFLQSEELSERFMKSAAYDQMFYDMMTEPEKALDFLQALFPAKLMAEAQEKAKARGLTLEDIALADDPQEFFRPTPQDHKPKEVKDARIVDVQLTDTPLPGHEIEAVSAEADMEAFREWQRQTGRA